MKTTAFSLAALIAVLPLLAALPATSAHAEGTASRTQSAISGTPHTFVYKSDPDVKSVSVAGTFNNWDKNAAPLVRDADGTIWRITLAVPFGRHQYKFVIDGEKWVTDPNATLNQDDGGGNINSILICLPPDYTRPARPDDSILATSALEHRQFPPFLNYDRGKLTLSLRLRPNDARKVNVQLGSRVLPLQLAGQDELYARYIGEIPWDRKSDLSYRFQIVDGNRSYSYGTNGLTSTGTAKPFQLTARSFKPYVVPQWVEKSVFYQIFPDRFDNGDKRNDPQDVQKWDDKPTYYNRYGGDIAGVRRHVNYLDNLGISAVYFNPVFQSPSNHRYDTQNYRKIDPQFGTNAEFSALTHDLDKRGIRTVMDFVFNHTATSFAPFQDIRDKGEASAYKNWYFIHSYPVKVQENPNYTAWYNFPSMPKLNVQNPPTRDYLLSLVNYWKQQVPLAGMRLDVANEVAPSFWRALRTRAKSIDPNLWIVGEVWGDGSPWLTGDQWDSVMNYQFRDACLRYFAEGKTTPTQFMGKLMAIHSSYAPQVSRNMMNLLSSHDTPRFLTQCGGNIALDQQAVALQFTWVGAPSIYYGEEIGMLGGPDPDNRRGMEWKKATANNPMLTYYKKLIRIRNSNPALQSGDPTVLLTDDKANTLAYARTYGNNVAVVALNRSSSTRTVTIPLSAGGTVLQSIAHKTGFVDALSGKRLQPITGSAITVTLLPIGAAILQPADRQR